MVEFFCHMKAGKILNIAHVRQMFQLLDDGQYIVRITKHATRSLGQNAYFHAVVLPVVLEGLRKAGWDGMQDIDDAKVVVKDLFAPRVPSVNRLTGETGELIRDTHKMTTVEFKDFIDNIIKWGAEYLNIQIPLPNEHIKNYG